MLQDRHSEFELFGPMGISVHSSAMVAPEILTRHSAPLRQSGLTNRDMPRNPG